MIDAIRYGEQPECGSLTLVVENAFDRKACKT